MLDYFWIFWIIFWNNLRGSAWWGVSKDPSHRFCLAHFHPANLEDGSNLMSIFSIFFHLDDFFAWFTCTPKTYVKSTPRRSKNWRLSIVHRKSNCRTEPRPTFFFLMVGGGSTLLGCPIFWLVQFGPLKRSCFQILGYWRWGTRVSYQQSLIRLFAIQARRKT